MEQRNFASASLLELQAHGFDLLSQVESFLRYAREIQQQVAVLKADGHESRRAEALHAIRKNAAELLRDCEPFCETIRDVQRITETVVPERRVSERSVALDRRRQKHR